MYYRYTLYSWQAQQTRLPLLVAAAAAVVVVGGSGVGGGGGRSGLLVAMVGSVPKLVSLDTYLGLKSESTWSSDV